MPDSTSREEQIRKAIKEMGVLAGGYVNQTWVRKEGDSYDLHIHFVEPDKKEITREVRGVMTNVWEYMPWLTQSGTKIAPAYFHQDHDEMEQNITLRIPASAIRQDRVDALNAAYDFVERMFIKTADGNKEIQHARMYMSGTEDGPAPMVYLYVNSQKTDAESKQHEARQLQADLVGGEYDRDSQRITCHPATDPKLFEKLKGATKRQKSEGEYIIAVSVTDAEVFTALEKNYDLLQQNKQKFGMLIREMKSEENAAQLEVARTKLKLLMREMGAALKDPLDDEPKRTIELNLYITPDQAKSLEEKFELVNQRVNAELGGPPIYLNAYCSQVPKPKPGAWTQLVTWGRGDLRQDTHFSIMPDYAPPRDADSRAMIGRVDSNVEWDKVHKALDIAVEAVRTDPNLRIGQKR